MKYRPHPIPHTRGLSYLLTIIYIYINKKIREGNQGVERKNLTINEYMALNVETGAKK